MEGPNSRGDAIVGDTESVGATPQEVELTKRLLSGRIPVSLLLHIQESAEVLGHGTIELVLTGKGSPIDVITSQRKRFK